MRTRCIAGAPVTSRPSNSMRPACGSRLPVIRLNRVDLPAPFGPITPKASPRGTAMVTESETFRAPNDFETLSRRRITAAVPVCTERGRRRSPPSATSSEGLHLAGRGNLGRGCVFDDHQLEAAAGFLPPLAADERRLADVLRSDRRDGSAGAGDLADHGPR